MYTKIISTGSYLPENGVTNQDLEHQVDTSDEWIRSRTGIEQRRIVLNDQNTLARDLNIKNLWKPPLRRVEKRSKE